MVSEDMLVSEFQEAKSIWLSCVFPYSVLDKINRIIIFLMYEIFKEIYIFFRDNKYRSIFEHPS